MACRVPQVRLDIQMAARDSDIARALGIYDHARAEGIRLSPDSYSTLLYLCSLGEAGRVRAGLA
jgi:hypothetical protein